MYDARVVDIPLFLIRRGRRGGGEEGRRELFRYDIMDICLGKKQFCLAPTGNYFKP